MKKAWHSLSLIFDFSIQSNLTLWTSFKVMSYLLWCFLVFHHSCRNLYDFVLCYQSPKLLEDRSKSVLWERKKLSNSRSAICWTKDILPLSPHVRLREILLREKSQSKEEPAWIGSSQLTAQLEYPRLSLTYLKMNKLHTWSQAARSKYQWFYFLQLHWITSPLQFQTSHSRLRVIYRRYWSLQDHSFCYRLSFQLDIPEWSF